MTAESIVDVVVVGGGPAGLTAATALRQAGAGSVVVIERESYPGILLIKRVMRADENGLWAEGDNKDASTDSRTWGLLAPREIVGHQQ